MMGTIDPSEKHPGFKEGGAVEGMIITTNDFHSRDNY
jgi:hypothetical protein